MGNPRTYKGLRFADGTQAAESAVREARRKYQPDLVIAAVVHAGLGSDHENMVRQIATRVTGIDAIVLRAQPPDGGGTADR